MTVILN